MRSLLSANLARLWKSGVFWLGLFALAAFCAIQKWGMVMDSGEVHHLEEAFWIQALVIGIILSVFISFFAGSEYEYGTVRNKAVAGHTRAEIYLANMLACILAGWIMCLGGLLVSLLIGAPFLGLSQAGLVEIFLKGICVFALSAAYAAIYCFFAMLISNRAISAVICVILSFLLLFAGSAAANRLDESEYYYVPDSSLGIGEIDGGSHSELMRNPDYLEGAERLICEIVYEMTPGGQSVQLSGMLDEYTRYAQIKMFSASCAWILLFCGCGLVLFRRKDLK